MLGENNPCKVIPLKNGLLRMGKPGVPHLKAGEMLYYLWHEDTNLYFKTCYVNQDYALDLASRTTGPRSMNDVAQSWVSEPRYCQHSFKTED